MKKLIILTLAFVSLQVYAQDLKPLSSKTTTSSSLNNENISDIASRVKAIIIDILGVEENEVVSEANFTNDLGADDLDFVELIMAFEKEFDIYILDEEAENITTVGRAISYIEAMKN